MGASRSVTALHSSVVETLNPTAREGKSVADVRGELSDLREELRSAHERVHLSEARLRQTQSRLADMESAVRAATTLGDMRTLERAAGGASDSSSSDSDIGGVRIDEHGGEGFDDQRPAREPLEARSTGGALREFWYPVDFSSTLTDDTLVPLELFGEPWVLFRDANGVAGCVRDSCAHRACPLSLGKNVGGKVQCPYHGWEFETDGRCTKTPSTNELKNIRVEALPVVERDGMIWVYPGEEDPPEDHQNFTALAPPGDEFTIHAEIVLTVPVEHGLLMENLLDLAHAPFTHTSTFAKGWSVPDRVDFKTVKNAVAQQIGGLGGEWQPYPIDMTFQPPCMVLSQIGLVKPGQVEAETRASDCDRHLHQLHVCLPAKDGETRLLYRMSLDFAKFAKNLPFVSEFWKELANQVLGEDLVLVEGQQRNMKAGMDVWSNPVAYDKLGVRYRRWRTGVQYGNPSLRSELTIE